MQKYVRQNKNFHKFYITPSTYVRVHCAVLSIHYIQYFNYKIKRFQNKSESDKMQWYFGYFT